MKSYELYFKDENNKETLVSDNITTFKECQDQIKNYLDNINYKYYYIRFFKSDNDFTFDYGSHDNFFILKDITEEELFSDEFNLVNKEDN